MCKTQAVRGAANITSGVAMWTALFVRAHVAGLAEQIRRARWPRETLATLSAAVPRRMSRHVASALSYQGMIVARQRRDYIQIDGQPHEFPIRCDRR